MGFSKEDSGGKEALSLALACSCRVALAVGVSLAEDAHRVAALGEKKAAERPAAVCSYAVLCCWGVVVFVQE